jgi:GMP reductase
MDTVGTWDMRNALEQFDMPKMIHKYYDTNMWQWAMAYPVKRVETAAYPTEILQRFAKVVKYTIASFGIRPEDTQKLYNCIEMVDYFPNMVCFDVANGYTQKYVDHIKRMRDSFQDKMTIIAGNVATPEGVEALVFAGADVVKCGIGPSKVCDTRIKTGVGVPQFTVTAECSDAAHGLGAHIISDGGIKTAGDVSKSFGAGADFVMIGSMFAGHTESGGKEVINNKKRYKEVYGMSSEHAMNTHYGSKADYRSSEGNYQLIEHRGPVENTVNDILGGLRSTMTYVGARRLKDLSKCATFIKVNRIK